MALLTRSELHQHRLLSLSTVGVLVASIATAVTWNVPQSRIDALAGQESVQDLLVEVGSAAGDALARGEAANNALGRSATTHAGGAFVLGPSGPLPVRTAGAVPQTDSRLPAAFSALGFAARDAGASAAESDSLSDAVATELHGSLSTLADAIAGTQLAASTGAIASASTTLAAQAAVLRAPVTTAGDPPQLDVVQLQRELAALVAAVEQHVAALDAVVALALPATPTRRLTALPGTSDATPMLDAIAAVAVALDAVTSERLDIAAEAAVAAGTALGDVATDLAWSAATLGTSALEDDGAAFARDLDQLAADLDTVPAAVVAASAAVAELVALPGSLADAVCVAAGCATPGLPAPALALPVAADTPAAAIPGLPRPAPGSGDNIQTSDSAASSLPAAPTPVEAPPTLPELVAAADLDGDGDVDDHDAAAATGTPAQLIVDAVLGALDTDVDGDVDEHDAAALIAITPIGSLAATLRATVEGLVIELATVLTSTGVTQTGITQTGDVGSDPAAQLTQTAAALVAATDTDGDGVPDRTGVVRLYNSVVEPLAPRDVSAAIVALRRTVELGLDRDRDGSLGISDDGCVTPAYGVYVGPAEASLARALADGTVDPSTLAALTIVQLVNSCAVQVDAAAAAAPADGATPGRTPRPDAVGAAVQAQVIGLMGMVAPACTADATRCTTAFEQLASSMALDARTAIEAAAAQLAATLDIDGDGELDRRDADAFTDHDLDEAWTRLVISLDALDDEVDGDAAGIAAQLYASRPTTAGVLAIADTLIALDQQLLATLDVDGDGAIDEQDAQVVSDALDGQVLAAPADTPSAPPASAGPTPTVPPATPLPDNEPDNEPGNEEESDRPASAPTLPDPGVLGELPIPQVRPPLPIVPVVPVPGDLPGALPTDLDDELDETLDDALDETLDETLDEMDDALDDALDQPDPVDDAVQKIVGQAIGGLVP